VATKKWSEFGGVVSVAEADEVVGLFGGDNDRSTIALLRNRLNIGTQNITGGINATGNIDGTHTGIFVGDGSGLTGIGTGTGGIINTGSTTIGADSIADGTGVIASQTRGITRTTIGNLGVISLGSSSELVGGKVIIAVTGAALDIVNQTDSTISFADAGTGIPQITSKHSTANQQGLIFSAATNNINSTADMQFNVLESDNSDFGTLTTPAYKFSRFGVDLVTLLRNGKLGLNVVNPGSTVELDTGAESNISIGQNSSSTTFNQISLNGITTDAGRVGLTGGASGNNDLFIDAPTGGQFFFRVNAVTVAGIGVSSLVGGAINATIDASANIIRDPSDVIFKDNPLQIENPMQLVRKLTGKTWDWKTDSMMGKRVYINHKTNKEITEILSASERKAYGLVYDDLKDDFPEMTTRGEYGSVHNEYLPAIHNEALKHLEDRIISLENK